MTWGNRRGFLCCVMTAWAAVSGGRGLAQDPPKADGQEFRSAEGNFLLWLPAGPEEISADRCPPAAKVWQASGPASLTLVQFGFVGGQQRMEGDAIDASLEGLARETAEILKGSLVSTKKITLGRWPGRELRIRFSAGEIRMCLLERMFRVGDTRLFVRIMVPEEESSLSEHRKVLDSFKLIDESRESR